MQTIHQNPSFQLLLSTTEKLILEKGCQQTTLQDIIKHSGLSKGAIYHYVKSKDELFGLLLQKRIESINHQFYQTIEQGNHDLERPLAAISEGFRYLHDPQDVTNLIFTYLLSKKEDPVIGAILSAAYEKSIQTSVEWITRGQQGGVIPASLDARKTAILFTIYTYGIRVHTIVAPKEDHLPPGDFYQFMYLTLKT